MADVFFIQGPGNGGPFLNYNFGGNLSLVWSGIHRFTMEALSGYQIQFKGPGLAYDLSTGVPTAGTVTEVTHTDPTGLVLRNITGLSIPAADAYAFAAVHGGVGLDELLLQEDDVLLGSRGADYMIGWSGNDVITGRAGRDTLIGGDGDDTLIGGGGVDIFQFGTSTEHDTVSDFNAANATAGHDRIDTTPYVYRHMTMTQVGADVELVYGNSHMTLLNTLLSDIDRGDFAFL